jgi:hypothetical protein
MIINNQARSCGVAFPRRLSTHQPWAIVESEGHVAIRSIPDVALHSAGFVRCRADLRGGGIIIARVPGTARRYGCLGNVGDVPFAMVAEVVFPLLWHR